MAEAADKVQQEASMYENQESEIQLEINEQPLIGAKEPISALKNQYKRHQIFTEKLKGLDETHEFRRSVRGDGHCFYRSMIFGFLEHFVTTKNADAITAMKTNAEAKYNIMVDKLHMPWTIESFYECYVEMCDMAIASIPAEDPNLNLIMKEIKDNDGYIMTYIRYMASAEVKTNEATYKPQVPNGNVIEFCKSKIEAINSEVDSIAVQAVSGALGLPFRICYLDQSKGGLKFYKFPHNQEPLIDLLYRPGHYDLIYPKSKQNQEIL